MGKTVARAVKFSKMEAVSRFEFAQAALGAAGHKVTDPYLVELLAQHSRGEISGDEARELSRKYVIGR